MFELKYTQEAIANLKHLSSNPALSKRIKAVKKALGYLSINPRHPSLATHEYTTLTEKFGFKVFEAYAENKTPGAYRIFWRYGPEERIITVLSVTPHP